jgi:lipoprotein-anchoring transpeptidase ErfK/SrfK
MLRCSITLATTLAIAGILSVSSLALAEEIPPPIEIISVPEPKIPNLEQPELPTEINLPLRLEIRLSRRQVLLYRGETVVKTYPIAVGRPGWETPTGSFKVMQKLKNPTWVHPLKPGVVIPGGDPENPLGRFWIGFWTDGKNWIGFHGTPTPKSVGRAASHGCIRMYNKDIEELFSQVNLGTVVTVVQ